MENAVAFGILALVILLLAQPWIWVIIFFLAGAASLIAAFVGIIYSEMLLAAGFLLLWLICWGIMVAISNRYATGHAWGYWELRSVRAKAPPGRECPQPFGTRTDVRSLAREAFSTPR